LISQSREADLGRLERRAAVQVLRTERIDNACGPPLFRPHRKQDVMHMLDWNTYRQQLATGVGGFGKLNPEIVKGYVTQSGAGRKSGHLDGKIRELIAVAVCHQPALRRLYRGPYRKCPRVGCNQRRDR
jgi:hypothetical protein